MITTWHHFYDLPDPRVGEQALSFLADAGVSSTPLSQTPDGVGVTFFHRVTPDLCDFLRTTSDSGHKRVFAVGIGGQAASADMWSLLHAGASDAIFWHDPATQACEIARRFRRWMEVDVLLESPLVTRNLIGTSPAWRTVLRQIVEVAKFTQASVLIGGESGTGKELVARLIHTLDARQKKGDLIVLDCTTIVPGLSGSEFFGHEKGAYTGASSARDGAFAMADGGSLFLDEVGELPLELQSQLLRVVQERNFKRVGGNTWQKTDFRLVCASNRDLTEEVKKGRFRADLFFRIAGWECRLPPLRDRREDIIPLALHFMNEMGPEVRLDSLVEHFLIKRDYPGNVRELQQLVTRIMYRHSGKGTVTIGDIPAEERPVLKEPLSPWCEEDFEQAIRRAVLCGVGLKEIGKRAEERAVDIVVASENGNLQRAAKILGVTDRALQMRRAARSNGGGEGGIDEGRTCGALSVVKD